MSGNSGVRVDRLTIPRPLWGRGALLNPDGTMYCLGHLTLATGCGPLTNDPKNEPGAIPWNRRAVRVKRGFPSSSDCREMGVSGPVQFQTSPTVGGDIVQVEFRDAAAQVNDDSSIPTPERERLLIGLFAQVGIELSFVDEVPADWPHPERDVLWTTRSD